MQQSQPSKARDTEVPLTAEGQAVVELLVKGLPGEPRKVVTETVERMLRPRDAGGTGLKPAELKKVAQESLDKHKASPRSSPLGYLVTLARGPRRVEEKTVETWAALATNAPPLSSIKELVEKMGLPAPQVGRQILELPEELRLPSTTCETCGGARWVVTRRVEAADEGLTDQEVGTCPACNTDTPEERRGRFLGHSGLSGPMLEMTMESLEEAEGLTAAVQAVGAVVEGEVDQAVLIGEPGVGKTHLAVAALHACLDRGMTALYLNTARFLDELRASYEPDARDSFEHLMLPALTWDLVVLDDLAGERGTDWAREKLFEIIDTRYSKGLRTIACSNVPMRLWDQRVVSRLGDTRRGAVVTIEVEDYRLRRR